MNFGQYFPESVIVCINPRLHLGTSPDADVATYVKKAFRVEGVTEFKRYRKQFVTENVASFFPEGLTSEVAILQNDQDLEYYEGQLLPFVAEFHDDSRLWVRTDSIGEGHVPYPKDTIHEVFGSLSDTSITPGMALARANFVTP
ncbi:hypothetical protein [Corynebacterium casei]|uniref:hypothetical protein n=1 Tax=Corynebacterium casei TaxID=160386 RepID=UPI003FD1FE0E